MNMKQLSTKDTTGPESSTESNGAPIRRVELRSEEVQEILGQMPGWALRWGITVMLVAILLLLLSSWFIHYPDTIDARITLTTQTPPAPIIARAEGRLQLKVANQTTVSRNQLLAIINNPAHYNDVDSLEKLIAAYKTGRWSSAQVLLLTREEWSLGEVQDAYLVWRSNLQNEALSQELVVFKKQIAEIQKSIQYYQRLNRQLNNQQQLLVRELRLAEKKFNRNQTLFREGTIAEVTFEESQAEWLQAQRLLETARASVTTNEIVTAQMEAQVTDLRLHQTQEQREQQNQIEAASQQLESQIASWRQQYVLTAPIGGTVSFTKYWSDAQYVQPNEEVITVVPHSDSLYGQVLMPIAGSGKVSVGQTVYIRFDNYPATEYGMVTGRVASISTVPREELYTIEVKLSKGLTTSYQKELPFRQEMQGSVEIITQDLRLLERLFYQLRRLVDRTT